MNTTALHCGGFYDGLGSREPTVAGLVTALKECTRSRDLYRGKLVHSQALDAGLFSNAYVLNTLINMYAKCGSMDEAQKVFDSSHSTPTSVAWTCLIRGYAANGQPELALQVYHRMDAFARPDARTFVAALSACASIAVAPDGSRGRDSLRWLAKGREIHSRASRNRCCNMFVESILVDMYARFGCMEEAKAVFDVMAVRDVVPWNALLRGYVENGESELALKLFDLMKERGSQGGCAPDSVSYVAALTACATLASSATGVELQVVLGKGREVHSEAERNRCRDMFVESALVDFYSKANSMVEAQSVFENMERKDTVTWNTLLQGYARIHDMQNARDVFNRMVHRDTVSWSSLIRGYVENGESEVALELIPEMDMSGVGTDTPTLVAALMACGNLMAVESGRFFHGEISNRGLDAGVIVSNCLVDFYGKCGCSDTAKQVFSSISEKTLVSWNSFMCGYSQQGDAAMVFDIFERMKENGFRPNAITFTHVLMACSHAGLTEQGREYFDTMFEKYGVRQDVIHYNCMVDLLCRANLLDEALRLVKAMPVKPDAVVWRTLIGACQKSNNATVGTLAYQSLLCLDDKDASAYVSMSNIFGGGGGSFQPGLPSKLCGTTTWTDELGKVHRFVTESHCLDK